MLYLRMFYSLLNIILNFALLQHALPASSILFYLVTELLLTTTNFRLCIFEIIRMLDFPFKVKSFVKNYFK